MAEYTTKPGDSPASIAAAFTGNPSRMRELVSVNASKPRVMVGNEMTFRDLHAGESIALPNSWGGVGLGALPHLGAFSGGGAYGTICAPVSMPIEQARQNLEAVIAANPSICSNASGEYPRDQTICDFQNAYNVSGLSPGIPLDATLNSNLDAELGPNSLNALNTYLASMGAGYSWQCINGAATKVSTPSASLTPIVMNVGDAYSALINDPALCGGGGSITASPLQSVINFQHAYNSTTPAPSPLIAETGIFDSTTLAAVNAASATIGGPIYDGTCGNPTPGYLSWTPGSAPNPQVPGGPTVTTTSTMTKVLLGGLALAVGAGAFMLLHKHAPTAAGHAGHAKAKHLLHGRKAARRRR